MRRRRKRRQISIASLKIFEEETSSSSSAEEEEAFLESGFEVSLGVCVFSKSSSPRDDDVDDAFVTDRTGTPSSSSSVEEEDEKEEEEEFVVRLSYAFDISNALVRSRLGTMMITNDKSENNNKDKDEEVLKTMVFTLKEESFFFLFERAKGKRECTYYTVRGCTRDAKNTRASAFTREGKYRVRFGRDDETRRR